MLGRLQITLMLNSLKLHMKSANSLSKSSEVIVSKLFSDHTFACFHC